MRIDGGGGHHTGPLKKNDKKDDKKEPVESFKERNKLNPDGKLDGKELKGLEKYLTEDQKKNGIGKEDYLKAVHKMHVDERKIARHEEFEGMDKTGNGTLTGKELGKLEKFATKEMLKDGITEDEFKDLKSKAYQKKLDTNFNKLFDDLDAKGDDKVSMKELEKGEKGDKLKKAIENLLKDPNLSADDKAKLSGKSFDKETLRKAFDQMRKDTQRDHRLNGPEKKEKAEKPEHKEHKTHAHNAK